METVSLDPNDEIDAEIIDYPAEKAAARRNNILLGTFIIVACIVTVYVLFFRVLQ